MHPLWALSRSVPDLSRLPGTEMDSSRGRIYQIVQVDAGKLALGDSFAMHIDRCLGCLNCQTACPSGVAYGGFMLERARQQIHENYQRPWLQRTGARSLLQQSAAFVFAADRPSPGWCASISNRDFRL